MNAEHEDREQLKAPRLGETQLINFAALWHRWVKGLPADRSIYSDFEERIIPYRVEYNRKNTHTKAFDSAA